MSKKSFQKCIAKIRAAAKDETLNDTAALRLLEEVDDFIRKNTTLDNMDAALAEHLQQRYDDSVLAALLKKRNRALNIVAEIRAVKHVAAFTNTFEGLKSYLGGSLEGRVKSKLSIDAQGKSLTNKYMGRLLDRMEQDGNLAFFNSGEFDREIAAELWEIRPNGKPGITGHKPSQEIAQVIHELQELAIRNANNSGAYIRTLPGYVMQQAHDMLKVQKAGMASWIDFIQHKLDERTFKGEDPRAFLEGAYRGLSTGIHRRYTGAQGQSHFQAYTGKANLAKKMSQERVLHFKSAEDFMSYHAQFGTGDLREGIVHGLTHLARNTALMRGLGTNPSEMLATLKHQFVMDAQKRNDVKLTQQLNNLHLDNLLAELDGTTRIPVNLSMAKINAGIRTVNNLSKLGGATISSVTDIAAQAAELRSSLGVNMFSSLANAFGNLFRGRGNAEVRSMAKRLLVGFDGITGDLLSRFHANDHIPGTGAKLQQKFFKLNLMSWWNDSHRTGMAMMMSNELADNASLSFNELGPRLQHVLRQYGIDHAEWDMYVKHGIEELDDGNRYMVSDRLETLDDDAIREYLTAKGQLRDTTSARRVADARFELVSMLETFYLDRVDHGIPMPGAAERAIMNRGSLAGTATGEVYRHVMQFKSFPVTMMRRVLGREIYGQLDGKADIVGLASLISLMTLFGYSALYMKDVLKGRTPRTFGNDSKLNIQIVLAAMTQGGGLGIYGDFLFGEFSRFGRSALSTAAGPTIGQVDTVAELWTKLSRGQDFGATGLQVIKDNTPFVNLFYTRMALDYLILYQLQEMTNPGYLSRLERRIMTENKQKFYVPPSRAIPRGGGSRLFEGVR